MSSSDVNLENAAVICRVCHCEGSDETPLYHPCKCSGSIKHVHQECLLRWLEVSGKSSESCELCGESYVFRSVYATGTSPPSLSIGDLLSSLVDLSALLIPFFGYVLFVIAVLVTLALLAKLYYTIFMIFVWGKPLIEIYYDLVSPPRFMLLDWAFFGFILHYVLYLGVLEVGVDLYDIARRVVVDRINRKLLLHEHISRLESNYQYLLKEFDLDLYIEELSRTSDFNASSINIELTKFIENSNLGQNLGIDKEVDASITGIASVDSFSSKLVSSVKASTLSQGTKHAVLCKLNYLYVNFILSKVPEIRALVGDYDAEYGTTSTSYYIKLQEIFLNCQALSKRLSSMALLPSLSLGTAQEQGRSDRESDNFKQAIGKSSEIEPEPESSFSNSYSASDVHSSNFNDSSHASRLDFHSEGAANLKGSTYEPDMANIDPDPMQFGNWEDGYGTYSNSNSIYNSYVSNTDMALDSNADASSCEEDPWQEVAGVDDASVESSLLPFEFERIDEDCLDSPEFRATSYHHYDENMGESKSRGSLDEQVVEGSSDNETDKDVDSDDVLYIEEMFRCARYGRNEQLGSLIDLNVCRFKGMTDSILNLRETDFGNTLMITSAQNGNLKTVKMLTKLGFDINAVNYSGMTALHYADKLGYHSVSTYLVSKGASGTCPLSENFSDSAATVKNDSVSDYWESSNATGSSGDDYKADSFATQSSDKNENANNNTSENSADNNLEINMNTGLEGIAGDNHAAELNGNEDHGGRAGNNADPPLEAAGQVNDAAANNEDNELNLFAYVAKKCVQFFLSAFSIFYRHFFACVLTIAMPVLLGRLFLHFTKKLTSIRDITSFVIVDIWHYTDSFLGIFQYLAAKSGDRYLNIFNVELNEAVLQSLPLRAEQGILNFTIPEKVAGLYNQTHITFPVTEHEIYVVNVMVDFFEKISILAMGYILIILAISCIAVFYIMLHLKIIRKYAGLLGEELGNYLKLSGKMMFVYFIELIVYPVVMGQIALISFVPLFSMPVTDWIQFQKSHVLLGIIFIFIMGYFMHSLVVNIIMSVHKSISPNFHNLVPIAAILPYTRRIVRYADNSRDNLDLNRYLVNSLYYFLLTIGVVMVMFLFPIKFGHYLLYFKTPISLKFYAFYVNVGSISMKSSISTLNMHVFMPATYSMYKSEFRHILRFLFRWSCRIVGMDNILVADPIVGNAAAAGNVNMNIAGDAANADGNAEGDVNGIPINGPPEDAAGNPDSDDEWENIADFEPEPEPELQQEAQTDGNGVHNNGNDTAHVDAISYSYFGFILKSFQLVVIYALSLYLVGTYFIHVSAYLGDQMFSLIRNTDYRDIESFQIGLFLAFVLYFIFKIIAKEAYNIPKSFVVLATVFRWIAFLLKMSAFLIVVFSWTPIVLGLLCQWIFFFPFVTPTHLIPCCSIRQAWTLGVMVILQLTSGMIVGGGPRNQRVQRQINFVSSQQWLRIEFGVLYSDLYGPFSLTLLDYFIIPFFLSTLLSTLFDSIDIKNKLNRYAYMYFLVLSLLLLILKSFRADLVKWYVKTRDSKYLLRRELSNR